MGNGMNLEEAKEYAKTMTYSEAVSNVRYSKGIKYRKATMIKLRELAEIADKLDRKTESSSEKPNNCDTCRHKHDGTIGYCKTCGESNYEPQERGK